MARTHVGQIQRRVTHGIRGSLRKYPQGRACVTQRRQDHQAVHTGYVRQWNHGMGEGPSIVAHCSRAAGQVAQLVTSCGGEPGLIERVQETVKMGSLQRSTEATCRSVGPKDIEWFPNRTIDPEHVSKPVAFMSCTVVPRRGKRPVAGQFTREENGQKRWRIAVGKPKCL